MKTPEPKNLAILTAKEGQFPKQAISLLDIMREFSAIKLTECMSALEMWHNKIRELPAGAIVSQETLADLNMGLFDLGLKFPKEWSNVHNRLWEFRQETATQDMLKKRLKSLESSYEYGKFADNSTKKRGDYFSYEDVHAAFEASITEPKIREVICNSLLEIEVAIREELFERKFVMLTSEESKLFNTKTSWINHIAKKLPSVKKDLIVARNCLAMNFHTAAVFHAMRAAEIGLRDLALKLQAEPLRKGKIILIEEAVWKELLLAINARIESENRLPKANRTIIKSGFGEFRLLTQHLDILRDTRNDVMHVHDFYNKSEAYGIFERVKHFLQKLVEKI